MGYRGFFFDDLQLFGKNLQLFGKNKTLKPATFWKRCNLQISSCTYNFFTYLCDKVTTL